MFKDFGKKLASFLGAGIIVTGCENENSDIRISNNCKTEMFHEVQLFYDDWDRVKTCKKKYFIDGKKIFYLEEAVQENHYGGPWECNLVLRESSGWRSTNYHSHYSGHEGNLSLFKDGLFSVDGENKFGSEGIRKFNYYLNKIDSIDSSLE